MKARRTKALEITAKVKQRVWDRDKEHCIFCQMRPRKRITSGGAKGALAQNRIFSQRADAATEGLTKEQKNNGNR